MYTLAYALVNQARVYMDCANSANPVFFLDSANSANSDFLLDHANSDNPDFLLDCANSANPVFLLDSANNPNPDTSWIAQIATIQTFLLHRTDNVIIQASCWIAHTVNPGLID